MLKHLRWLGRLLLLTGLCLSPLTGRAEARLVSAAWLQQQLGSADLRVLDASPPSLYRKGHIPGAVSASLYGSDLRESTPAQMQARLRAWGLKQGERVVVVDQGGSWMAPRLLWDLLHVGVPARQLFLLDGGMAQWRAQGGALSSEATAPPAGDIRVLAFDESVRVRLPEFLAASGEPTRQLLLEALDPPYYYGGAAFFNRAGHVPHATLMPADDFFDADKRFKPAAEIRRMLQHQGWRPGQPVLSYCGGGGAAAVPYFALRFLVGHAEVRLFHESQLGWLQDPRELPLWTYAQPQLLRDARWAKAFAGPMLKAMGMSRVSLLDLRDAEAYAQGHLPMALHLPLQAFRELDDTALAARLGQAGLDAGDEAVLIAEGGLSPGVALALLRLEQLGQRASLLLDGTEAWAERGQELAKPQAPPRARPYPAPTPRRDGPLLNDPAQAPGLYPSLVVASGLKPLPGAAIHLPYTELLDARGHPLPADQLWARLAKAGVPRYAQLLLVADDIADAAVNHALLRLMGWRDVKVLASAAK